MSKNKFIILIVFIFVLWGTSGLIISSFDKPGQFGDMFGAINSLFAGLAFAGLIYTIGLQRTELGLQRKELELTRAELKEQRVVMEAQNDQITIQIFEGTFFQMLRLHNEIIESIDITIRKKIKIDIGISETLKQERKGRDAFLSIWHELKPLVLKKTEKMNKENRLQYLRDSYKGVYESREIDLAHYFMSLYNIIKFVDKSDVKNKKQYTNIVRAHISGQELLLLLYNGIYYSSSKFVPLMNKYAILKHIPIRAVPSPIELEFYSVKAFGGQYPKLQNK